MAAAAAVCLPVLKFSYTGSTPRSESTVSWQHITSDDLLVTLDGDGQDATLNMCILQRNETLEEIEVGKLVDEAMITQHHLERTNSVVSLENLPIFGMTKDMLLAVRYHEKDGQSRRLQLRMHTLADCHQVLTILQTRGMEFSGPGTGRPNTARLGTGTSQHRILTAQPKPAVQRKSLPTARPSPFNLAPLEAGSYSQNRPPTPSRQPSPRRALAASQAASHEHTSSMYFSRDERTAPRLVEPNRPTTAQVFRSHVSGSQRESTLTAENNPGVSTSLRIHGSSSSSARGNGSKRPSTYDLQALPYDHGTVSSGGQSSKPTLPSSDTSTTHVPTARPVLAKSSPFPPTLEHEIPPPRELPFKRPNSRQTGSAGSSSRPASALGLPPLPRPSTAQKRSVSPMKSVGRPSTSSPLKRPFETFASGHEAEEIRHTDASSPSRQSPVKLPVSGPAVTPFHEPTHSPMEELLARKRSQAEASSNSRLSRLNSLADAPHEIVSPPSTAVPTASRNAQVASVDPPAHRDVTTENASARDQIKEQEASTLKQYAAQSLEDRASALEEFMVSNLESNLFTTLCQDVENCWQRIALGL